MSGIPEPKTSSGPPILDALSRLHLRRFLCCLVLFLVCAQLPGPRSAASGLAIMAAWAAMVETVLALLTREKIGGASFNRWDVAVAFLGVYYAMQIIG